MNRPSKDKAWFITGAGSGMGLKCAELLLQDGARVAALDIKLSPMLFERAGCEQLLAIEGDVSNPAVVRSAVEQTVGAFGGLDCAINAAGITGRLEPILEQDDDALDRLMAVNIKGIFLGMKYEAGAIRKGGGGAIVNFASVFARGAHENMVLYGATKHAVAGLTQGAAVEFAAYDIRVNAVAPGPILTPLLGEITPELEHKVVSGIPQQRIGQPEEVARAAIWLCSDEASYITGSVLSIDGGQAARLSG